MKFFCVPHSAATATRFAVLLLPLILCECGTPQATPPQPVIRITTNMPGYFIEVADTIVGVSPCAILRPQRHSHASIVAIPSPEIEKYAAENGVMAMSQSKWVSDLSQVSHVHLDTFFAGPLERQKRFRSNINAKRR